MPKKYKLEIELQSATNPGSGEGWAGMIDSDIVFDDFGLPYIPARRIKGILREMAGEVVSAFEMSVKTSSPFKADDVETLFGRRGMLNNAPLSLGNAYLEEYEKLKIWMQWAKLQAPLLATPDNIIAAFTHVRKQTQIDAAKGIAQNHSLRQTRVLNSGHKFISPIELGEVNEKLIELFVLAVGVTRALGGKRNRGLGKISCRLKNEKNEIVDALENYRTTLTTEAANG